LKIAKKGRGLAGYSRVGGVRWVVGWGWGRRGGAASDGTLYGRG